MAVEIERKFLVKNDLWRSEVRESRKVVQGYITRSADSASGRPLATIRVRICDDREAFLTVKGRGEGISRAEFEYAVPVSEARAMLAMCEDRVITKTRHIIPADGVEFYWEVDVFEGRHEGLIVAEIELAHVDQEVPQPEWLGAEVSGDMRYLNEVMANERSA